jgi:hypothetical protein
MSSDFKYDIVKRLKKAGIANPKIVIKIPNGNDVLQAAYKFNVDHYKKDFTDQGCFNLRTGLWADSSTYYTTCKNGACLVKNGKKFKTKRRTGDQEKKFLDI